MFSRPPSPPPAPHSISRGVLLPGRCPARGRHQPAAAARSRARSDWRHAALRHQRVPLPSTIQPPPPRVCWVGRGRCFDPRCSGLSALSLRSLALALGQGGSGGRGGVGRVCWVGAQGGASVPPCAAVVRVQKSEVTSSQAPKLQNYYVISSELFPPRSRCRGPRIPRFLDQTKTLLIFGN